MTMYFRPSRAQFRREVGLHLEFFPRSTRLLRLHRYAHDRLTEFMSSRGFTVTRQYLGLATAWRAEFRRDARGSVGRTVGVNAEMDALPGIGHGCGHNLIAMAGVAIALALQAALEKHDVPGMVILLGTPGAYNAIMLHVPYYNFNVRCACPYFPRLPPSPQPKKVAPASRSSLRRAPIKIWTFALCTYFKQFPFPHRVASHRIVRGPRRFITITKRLLGRCHPVAGDTL